MNEVIRSFFFGSGVAFWLFMMVGSGVAFWLFMMVGFVIYQFVKKL